MSTGNSEMFWFALLRNVINAKMTSDPDEIRKILSKTNLEKLKIDLPDYTTAKDAVEKINSDTAILLSAIVEDPRASVYFSGKIDEDFIKQSHKAAVISIDIRNSTELMLKANSSDDFNAFITELVEEMIKCIKKNYGIFEKFTGDGILACFPCFYSGTDSCGYAINSAYECHEIFENKYKKYHKNFIAAINNTGLGIGIDYGGISFKIISKSVYIIGKPVVYACRMGGIEGGNTAINIQVYEEIYDKLNGVKVYPEKLLLKTGENLKCYIIRDEIGELKNPVWV